MNVVVFGISTNAVVVAMEASGYFDTLGVEVTPLPGVAWTNAQLAQLDPSQGVSDTLFAMILTVGKVFVLALDLIFAFPNLMRQLLAQGWLVDLIFAANVVIWAAAITYLFLGREF